jgi:putative tryptophan/tyrosine transport system substrate-binding protein
MNHRRTLVITLGAGLLMARLDSFAQQPTKLPRIGYLSLRSGGESRDEAFRHGLRELGYVEGKNIVLELRYGDGKADRLRELAAELVRLKVDVIVSAGPFTTRAAKEATAATPIVMAYDPDPVGSGFAASLARPGGNITGLSALAPEIAGKQLAILKTVLPRLSHLAILGNSTRPGNAQSLREVESAAGKLGVELQYIDVLRPEDIETAFQSATKARADAVLILLPGNFLLSRRKQIAELAAKGRLPAMLSGREYVEDGALMSYGVSFPDLFGRAATYVDKILKGAKPGDLPIEQPTKFELVVNAKTAKTLGIKIPQAILVQATEVIE